MQVFTIMSTTATTNSAIRRRSRSPLSNAQSNGNVSVVVKDAVEASITKTINIQKTVEEAKKTIDQSKAQLVNDKVSTSDIAQIIVPILIEHANLDDYNVRTMLDNTETLSWFKSNFTHWSVHASLCNHYITFVQLGWSTYNNIIMKYFTMMLYQPTTDFLKVYTTSIKPWKSEEYISKLFDDLELARVYKYHTWTYPTTSKGTTTVALDRSTKTEMFMIFLASLEMLVDNKVMFTTGFSVAFQLIKSLIEKHAC